MVINPFGLPARDQAVLVSHQWISDHHPDPEAQQLKATFQLRILGKMVLVVSLGVWRAGSGWLRGKIRNVGKNMTKGNIVRCFSLR